MAPGKNHVLVTAISTEIFKYVRIHPNFASWPVWCEKMFLCCFFQKAGRKTWQTGLKFSLSPPPPPPPPTPLFLPCSTGFLISRVSKFSIFQEERINWGGGGGGWEERTLGLFVKSFLPAFRKKTTQEHLFTLHRSACEVWVDSDILENFSRNGGYVVLARSHSIISFMAVCNDFHYITNSEYSMSGFSRGCIVLFSGFEDPVLMLDLDPVNFHLPVLGVCEQENSSPSLMVSVLSASVLVNITRAQVHKGWCPNSDALAK